MLSKQTPDWVRLDNAAKIFPSSSDKRDTKVFRFSCELREEILPTLLQDALDRAVEEFPVYRSVLKQGFFWHYLERSSLRPEVHEESEPPCAPLYHVNSRNLLFQVTYYKTRINLEIYHALTDGTGALQFLSSIVCFYLSAAHREELQNGAPRPDYDASRTQKAEDSFLKYYETKKMPKEKRTVAYQLRGAELPEGRIRVIEGICPAKELLSLAHRYHATATVYLTAVMLRSIADDMSLRERRKPVVVSIPVNLRNFFDSETARNFFSVIDIGYRFEHELPPMEELIGSVQRQFEQKLTQERMSAQLGRFIAIEKNPFTRITPLFFKRLVLRIAHNRNQREHSVSLSNLGRIAMPEEFAPYIDRFSVFVSTKHLQACVCSFGGKLSVSFTSAFADTEVQKNFFRALTREGVPVEIVSNLLYHEEAN